MIPRFRSLPAAFLPLLFLVPSMLFVASGCGSGQEAQMEALSGENMRMRHEMDSLMSLNRSMMQQVEALAAENRVLTSRTADLEVRLRESVPNTPMPPAPTKDPGAGYAAALSQYMARDFSGAMARFESLLKEGISEDLKDNCHYWIGECLYGMGKYSEAVPHFETALALPHSDKQDDSMLMIANSYALMGNKSAAREWYNKLISTYPASPYLPKAKEKLSSM